MWIYRLVDENFKDPFERMTPENFEDEILALDISFENGKNVKLETIPRHIFLLKPVLRQLTISGQALTEIPEELSEFAKLDKLDLSDNKIRRVSQSLFSMPKLDSINLDKNQIEEVENTFEWCINDLPCFLFLNLSHNPLKGISKDIIERIDGLELEGCQLSSLPAADYSNLKELGLENNNLTILPQELQQARALHSLRLEGNPLPRSLLPEGATDFNFSEKQLTQDFLEKLMFIDAFISAE